MTQINKEQYIELYQQSINDPQGFWGKHAEQYLTWFKPWETVLSGNLPTLDTQWFQGATLNVAYNCLDRHLPDKADKIALIWEGDEPSQSIQYTYQALHREVCRFANVLKQYGVKKGDRVCLYLPMIPEAVIAMLACARIGAIHSVVFGGFSAEALKIRLLDANCSMVITANEGVRGNKLVPLKQQLDIALQDCDQVKQVIVIQRTQNPIAWNPGRDRWYHEAIQTVSDDCPPEIMKTDDPLFILYTSGSTGSPKGILHSSGNYLLYAAMTYHIIFDHRENDVFWCTADVGWITGHSYAVYGPLANGGTTVIFEGVPHYPTPSRFWEVIDKHQVTIFYTAPTAIRALRREGDQWVEKTRRDSLRLLGSVGEPINPEAWKWYYDVVGKQRCPVIDTWWQTETGGIMISPLSGVTPLKPGSAAWPFFGILPKIVDDQGNTLPDGQMGNLVIEKSWPGMMKTVYQDPERFSAQYFQPIPGVYLTGDQAYRDAEGYFWISGRSDDVLKISGHRIGTQEVESALIKHPAVSEAAVVGIPDEIKGQSIYAFVTLKVEMIPSDTLKKELVQTVRKLIGPIATPEHIHWAEGLPKTRSGKIMRRLLRKIAVKDVDDLGDLSTLTDPGVIQALLVG